MRLDGVELERPPASPPPVLIGTTGARGLALAGAAADGVLLPEGSVDAAVRWARGASGGAEILAYAWLSLADEDDAALDAIRPIVQAWHGAGNYPRLAELAELREDGPPASTPPRCAGSPSRALPPRARRRYGSGGRPAPRAVVLAPAAGRPAEQLERFAADVLPLLRGGVAPSAAG